MVYDPLKPGTEQIREALLKARKSSVAGYEAREPYGIVDLSGLPSRLMVVHADGVGTKGQLHWRYRTFSNAARDAFAMNVDDLPMARAMPFLYVTHIIIPEDDTQAAVEVIRESAELCSQHDILMPAGGETAVLDTLDGIEIGGFCIGYVNEHKENIACADDVLIGIESSGVHSNGYTFIRKEFTDGEIERWQRELVEPTRIYYGVLSGVIEKFNVHGLMHVTGGGLAKTKRMLKNTNAWIRSDHSLKPQEIFRFMAEEKGVRSKDMLQRFNCGIGYVLSVRPEDADAVLAEIRKTYPADVIGEVFEGRGEVHVDSPFEKVTIMWN
ncbi:MAG: hypothetical protein HYW25_03175 [Candidatus Aenigmarchaeota archaeon]|nr:hypothetical protein [Candidatus Aenigmarchaeota archaeon]